MSIRFGAALAPTCTAADFGANKPLYHSGEYESKENCDFYIRKLRARGFRNDIEINVEPLARSIQRLAPDVELLMKNFSYWWGGKNGVWVEELHGPELEPRNCRERGWFDYFAVIAPLQENHGSHAHIVVAEELTGWDLVERLHSIGLDSRADLARVLQETDPFKARSTVCCFHSAPKGRTCGHMMFELVVFQVL